MPATTSDVNKTISFIRSYLFCYIALKDFFISVARLASLDIGSEVSLKMLGCKSQNFFDRHGIVYFLLGHGGRKVKLCEIPR